MSKVIYIKANLALGRAAKGEVVECKVNAGGVPLDAFWRARIEDAKIDGCVTVYSDKTSIPRTVVSNAKMSAAKKVQVIPPTKSVPKPKTVQAKKPGTKKATAKNSPTSKG